MSSTTLKEYEFLKNFLQYYMNLLNNAPSGNNGGKIKKFTKFPILIPSKNTALIQVLEIFIGQIYCKIIEDYFYMKNKK
jgi:hypothetical protein